MDMLPANSNDVGLLSEWAWPRGDWEIITGDEVADMHAALTAPDVEAAERAFGITADPELVSPEQYRENRALLRDIRQHWGGAA